VFDFLCYVNQRPEPFSQYTARELWTDPHTAQQMLAYHLNAEVDAASRNHDFIDRSADWIASRFGLRQGIAVADFGCGPGLYASRLARTGAAVLGVDFSATSLRHASEAAQQEGLSIDFVEADYLSFETERRFDLIIMIMCDFCALGPDQRATLLQRFRSLLAPGGAVLFDVYSPEMFQSREETATYAVNMLDGFWSSEEYFAFLTTFKYEDCRLLLDKYTIVARTRTREVFNWLQCFTPAELEEELERSGLRAVELLGDVAGSAFDPVRTEFAVVASRAQ
jgi:SAM-dependent methyltransferase